MGLLVRTFSVSVVGSAGRERTAAPPCVVGDCWAHKGWSEEGLAEGHAAGSGQSPHWVPVHLASNPGTEGGTALH